MYVLIYFITAPFLSGKLLSVKFIPGIDGVES